MQNLKQRPKRRRLRKLLVRPETWKFLVLVAKAIAEIIEIFRRFF